MAKNTAEEDEPHSCPKCPNGVTLTIVGWLAGIRVVFVSCDSCDYTYFKGF